MNSTEFLVPESIKLIVRNAISWCFMGPPGVKRRILIDSTNVEMTIAIFDGTDIVAKFVCDTFGLVLNDDNVNDNVKTR